MDLDPWLFSCLYTVVDQVDINEEASRQKIKAAADELLARIVQKYQEHGIQEKPYLVLKADAGTYGMGVTTIEDSVEILHLNRKERNNLFRKHPKTRFVAAHFG